MNKLVQDFDVVILATGDPTYVDQIKIPGYYLKIYYKEAMVTGTFNKNRVDIFQNHNIAPQSFGYLVPMDEDVATLRISFPLSEIDHSINLNSINMRWDHFFEMVNNSFTDKLSLVEEKGFLRTINQYSSRRRIGNSYLTGNCLGSVMPMLGYDQYFALSSGAYGAYSVLGYRDYDKLKSGLMRQLSKLLTISRGMAKLSNSYYDAMARALDTEAGKLFFASKYDVLKVLSPMMYPLAKK